MNRVAQAAPTYGPLESLWRQFTHDRRMPLARTIRRTVVTCWPDVGGDPAAQPLVTAARGRSAVPGHVRGRAEALTLVLQNATNPNSGSTPRYT